MAIEITPVQASERTVWDSVQGHRFTNANGDVVQFGLERGRDNTQVNEDGIAPLYVARAVVMVNDERVYTGAAYRDPALVNPRHMDEDRARNQAISAALFEEARQAAQAQA